MKKVILVLLMLLTGCVGNKQLYCGIKDMGDTQKYNDNFTTQERTK